MQKLNKNSDYELILTYFILIYWESIERGESRTRGVHMPSTTERESKLRSIIRELSLDHTTVNNYKRLSSKETQESIPRENKTWEAENEDTV